MLRKGSRHSDMGRLVSLVDLNVNLRGQLGSRDARGEKVCSPGCGRGKEQRDNS